MRLSHHFIKAIFIISMIPVVVVAQEFNTINANNIKTTMHSSGPMFWDLDRTSTFRVPYDGPETPAAIFSGGLWLSGLTADGGLQLIAQEYRSVFNIGPVNAEFIDFDFDKVWKVTAADINALRADFQDNGTVDDLPVESLREWPAIGNNIEPSQLYSGQILAPFHDVNQDNIYNPFEGDYPVVMVNGCEIIPDELLYTLYHANGVDQPVVEIHSIFYAFESQENEVINNSLFLQQKICLLYTSPSPRDS